MYQIVSQVCLTFMDFSFSCRKKYIGSLTIGTRYNTKLNWLLVSGEMRTRKDKTA